MGEQPTNGTERGEWYCEECGEVLTYPKTRVLKHYVEEHADDYSHCVSEYQTGDGKWRSVDTDSDRNGDSE